MRMLGGLLVVFGIAALPSAVWLLIVFNPEAQREQRLRQLEVPAAELGVFERLSEHFSTLPSVAAIRRRESEANRLRETSRRLYDTIPPGTVVARSFRGGSREGIPEGDYPKVVELRIQAKNLEQEATNAKRELARQEGRRLVGTAGAPAWTEQQDRSADLQALYQNHAWYYKTLWRFNPLPSGKGIAKGLFFTTIAGLMWLSVLWAPRLAKTLLLIGILGAVLMAM